MKRNAILTMVTALLLLVSFCAVAQEQAKPAANGESFVAADNFYRKGDYTAALAEYEKILSSGYESGNLYYNLANSYFKSGNLGKAVLNYERARRLIPRDSDLRSSYKYARDFVKRTARPSPKMWPFRVMDFLIANFTINEITIFLSGVFILFAIAVLIHLYFNWLRRYYLMLVIVLAAIFILGAAILGVDIRRINREAVMVIEKANAKFEPFERATTHFTLYEGMKVTILAFKDEWCKVRRADGRIGWIKKSDIEVI